MGVPTSTVVIVAVCAALAALVLLFVLVRFLSRRAVPPAPFPPVQPLAHHREHQLATHSWYSSQQPHLSAPQPFGSASPQSSRASLLTKNSPAATDSESALSSPQYHSNSLPLPSPSFHPPRPSSSSSVGSSDPGLSPTVTPLEPSTLPPRASQSPGRRARPLSLSSTHSTVHSKTGRNTLRGTPHSRHSQIQIVLPTPLSPDLTTSMGDQRRLTTIDPNSYDRTSVVDRWVSTPSHPLHSIPGIHEDPGPHLAAPSMLSKPPARRAVSNPSLSRGSLDAPPVPRVPSMYIASSIPEA